MTTANLVAVSRANSDIIETKYPIDSNGPPHQIRKGERTVLSRTHDASPKSESPKSQGNAKSSALQAAGGAILAGADLLLSLQSSAGNQATLQRKQGKKDVASTGRMPLEVQFKMESAMNADFSDVTIHPNSDKASKVGALAYTQGTDIHFAPGQYDPSSGQGQQLLGHELAHVVQQKAGRVKPTGKLGKDTLINSDPSLESEADQMGLKAATSSVSSAVPIQRAVDKAGAAPTIHSSDSLVIQRT